MSLLLLYFFTTAVLSVRGKSIIYDEANHLAAGYLHLKHGDYSWNVSYPPLLKMWAALPLLGSGAKTPSLERRHHGWKDDYELGDRFLYHNAVSAESILLRARIPMVLVGVLLGFFVWRWSSALYGRAGGLISLAFYALSPVMTAQTRFVKNDVGVAAGIFVAMYAFWLYLKDPGWRTSVLVGLAAGAALAAKYSAFVLFPVMLLCEAWWFYSGGRRPRSARGLFLHHVLAVGVALLVVAACYRFVHLPVFFEGFRQIVGFVSGHQSFLCGQHSTTGWWYYFPVVFLLKTPLPFLIVVLSVLGYSIRKKGFVLDEALLLLPLAVYTAGVLCSSKNVGIPHLVPVYPFLFVLSGKLARLFRWGSLEKAVLAGLLLWSAAAHVSAYPHYLSWFNELAGGKGHRFLVDSNLDWGQDLGNLKRYLDREGVDSVILSYFGNADPAYHGIRYRELLCVNEHSRKGNVRWDEPLPERQLLAVGATNLQNVYYNDKNVFSWLEALEPEARVGRSIFVYDITGDARAHNELGIIYMRSKDPQRAFRHFERAAALEPSSATARQNLAMVRYALSGRRSNPSEDDRLSPDALKGTDPR